MAVAEGYVHDAPSGNAIAYATLYTQFDGYWQASSAGWWATANAYEGSSIQGSAPNHDPKTVTFTSSDWRYEPALGYDVLWKVISLDRTTVNGGSTGTTSNGW